MEFAKKYVLVPEETVSKHMPSKEHMSTLDKEMQKILSSNLSEDEKVKLYYELLQKKLKVMDYNPPVQQQLVEQPVEQPVEEEIPIKTEENFDDIILSSVPKNMKRYASNFLQLLKRYENVLSWNEKGEISVRQKRIPDSSIADLIHMMFLNTAKNFRGKEEFLKALSEMNIPSYFIKNKYLREPEKKASASKPVKRRKTYPKHVKWETF